jgi:hypothetical protein
MPSLVVDRPPDGCALMEHRLTASAAVKACESAPRVLMGPSVGRPRHLGSTERTAYLHDSGACVRQRCAK